MDGTKIALELYCCRGQASYKETFAKQKKTQKDTVAFTGKSNAGKRGRVIKVEQSMKIKEQERGMVKRMRRKGRLR